jgi:hypothetical protein
MTATKAAKPATVATEPTKPVEATKPVGATKLAEAAKATEPTSPAGWRRPAVGEAVDAVLHAYEELVANFVEFEHKAAATMRSERVRAAINLHATFIEDLTAVYVRTARAAMR